MPSAANAKSEKPASSEAMDNSPIRQIITVIEHKIRNLEKRKSKLTSYRDLQKSGKELNSDQKVAVAKYDEVAQTLEFARDLSKQISGIAVSAEREAKKQAKKDAWIRYATDANKIREVLLILDCLTQMGNEEAREDFLHGTNGAAKLTEQDLKVLDDLYPEVTPKHELNEEGQPGFHSHSMKAAEHLYSIIDGKPKEVLGTTYTHIKEIVTSIHSCGYFDKVPVAEVEAVPEEEPEPEQEAPVVEAVAVSEPVFAGALPVPPAPGVVPAPAYPLRAMPPLTLQEIEHAYFTQQYQQQRPISEVIGSQNFFFLQESEIDSPTPTPQPPMNQQSPPAPIPTQTFTNQHFVEALPMPHFPPREFPVVPPLHAPLPPQPAPPAALAAPIAATPAHPAHPTHPAPHSPPQQPASPTKPTDEPKPPSPQHDNNDDEWKESQSPERESGERRTQGQGDGQRFRRYGRGGTRGATNGYRGRPFGGRPAGDYHPRHDHYRKDGYPPRHDHYQPRAPRETRDRDYYGNGEADSRENGSRERDSYGSYKGRGRTRPAPSSRGPPPAHAHGPARAPRQFARKPDKPE